MPASDSDEGSVGRGQADALATAFGAAGGSDDAFLSEGEDDDDDMNVFSDADPSSPPPGEVRVLVDVTGYSDRQDAQGHRYTTYDVLVRHNGRRWIMRKRYKQFETLREAVRGVHPIVDSFKFPHKSTFNTFADFTKERRRQGFEDWLTLLVQIIPRPDEVDAFLRIGRVGALEEHPHGRRSSTSPHITPPRMNPGRTPKFPPLIDADLATMGNVHNHEGYDGGTSTSTPTTSTRPTGNTGLRASRVSRSEAGSASVPRSGTEGRRGSRLQQRRRDIAEGGELAGKRGAIRGLDSLLRKACGPLVLAVMVVLVCIAVTVVIVWRVSGTAGLVTLCVGVVVGLLIQSRDWALSYPSNPRDSSR